MLLAIYIKARRPRLDYRTIVFELILADVGIDFCFNTDEKITALDGDIDAVTLQSIWAVLGSDNVVTFKLLPRWQSRVRSPDALYKSA